MQQPLEITQALIVDALARRYGVLPTVILAADARNFQIATIAARMASDG